MPVSDAALLSTFASILYLCIIYIRPYRSDKLLTSLYILFVGYAYSLGGRRR